MIAQFLESRAMALGITVESYVEALLKALELPMFSEVLRLSEEFRKFELNHGDRHGTKFYESLWKYSPDAYKSFLIGDVAQLKGGPALNSPSLADSRQTMDAEHEVSSDILGSLRARSGGRHE